MSKSVSFEEVVCCVAGETENETDRKRERYFWNEKRGTFFSPQFIDKIYKIMSLVINSVKDHQFQIFNSQIFICILFNVANK